LRRRAIDTAPFLSPVIGRASRSWFALRTDGLSGIARVVGLFRLRSSNSRTICRVYRTGHGAKNMTIVRRFALGLVRANKAKGSVKPRRKTAGWSPDFLLEILQLK
jgi:hypothetical protein